MLTKIIPILIITLIIFSPPFTADNIEVLYTNRTPPEDWLMVRPGENITLSFNISLEKGRSSILVPVPEIYTYIYPNIDTSYRITTNSSTYQYLTCNLYDNPNITLLAQTLAFPINITVLENNSSLYVEYIFTPPTDQYNSNITFFVQNTPDISYVPVTEPESIDWIFLWVLVIPISLIASLGIYHLIEESTTARRRRMRGTLRREHRQHIDRMRNLRDALQEAQSQTAPPIYTPPTPPPPTTFKCQNKATHLREFIKGDGLFEIGIKKFKTPSFDTQTKMIYALPEVSSFSSTSLETIVNLSEHGKYIIKIKAKPTVYRMESNGSTSHRNPYISSDNHRLCLGTGQTLYSSCYTNKNYVECIRVICKILKSKDGKGYRTWSECET